MFTPRWLLALIPIAAAVFVIGGMNAGAPSKGLAARSITLQGTVSLKETLKQLRAQTGNAIADRRLTKSDPRLSLVFNSLSFWPALEEIARQTDARISTYQQDGTIALVDGPY